MSTVFLHIGTQKTGTTALQSFLRENDERLEKNGYSYPLMKLNLSSIYRDRNAHFLIYKSLLEDKAEKKREEQEIWEKGFQIIGKLAETSQNIVLSDELVWHHGNHRKNFWADLVEEFRKVNCEVKVIVYLRRQDLLVQSLWNQSIKGAPRIHKSFQECMKTDHFRYYPLDYYRQLMKIAEQVNKENMIVRIYEKDQYEGTDRSIYSDFLHNIGLELTDAYTNDDISVNLGISGNYVEMKRLINGIPEYQEMSDFLRRPISLACNYEIHEYQHARISMFTPEEQEAYINRFDESNARVAREFLQREDGRLFLEPVKVLPVWTFNQEEFYRDLLLYTAETFCQQEEKILALKEEVRAMKSDVKAMHNSLIFRIYRKIRKVIRHRD